MTWIDWLIISLILRLDPSALCSVWLAIHVNPGSRIVQKCTSEWYAPTNNKGFCWLAQPSSEGLRSEKYSEKTIAQARAEYVKLFDTIGKDPLPETVVYIDVLYFSYDMESILPGFMGHYFSPGSTQCCARQCSCRLQVLCANRQGVAQSKCKFFFYYF